MLKRSIITVCLMIMALSLIIVQNFTHNFENKFKFAAIFIQINHGQVIPQKYYISEKVGMDKDKMTTISVIRGNSYNLSYDIKYPGTVIRYCVQCSHPIFKNQ